MDNGEYTVCGTHFSFKISIRNRRLKTQLSCFINQTVVELIKMENFIDKSIYVCHRVLYTGYRTPLKALFKKRGAPCHIPKLALRSNNLSPSGKKSITIQVKKYIQLYAFEDSARNASASNNE